MKAVGYTEVAALGEPGYLCDLELPVPEPGPRDLLVRVCGIGVNPLDVVARGRLEASPQRPVVLGWDAAGTVEAVGPEATMFEPGDEVYFAGSLDRPGCNAEYVAVDERVVARKPKSLSFAQAAALPLAGITAWEGLFDRLAAADSEAGGVILMVGAAGGVGSLAVQLACLRTDLFVVGSASRPESRAWVEELGANAVIDHRRPLAAQIETLGQGPPALVLAISGTATHWPQIVEALAPCGQVCVFDAPPTLDAMPLRQKSGAVHLEMMWARVRFDLPDLSQIHRLLGEISRLVDDGSLQSVARRDLGPMSAASLTAAHAEVAAGRTVGKLVLTGF